MVKNITEKKHREAQATRFLFALGLSQSQMVKNQPGVFIL